MAKLQGKYKDWPPDHFFTWSQPDFERYYPARFANDVETALAKNHHDKREAKKRLLDEVKAWCSAHPEEAKAAFAESAAEVIAALQSISKRLMAT